MLTSTHCGNRAVASIRFFLQMTDPSASVIDKIKFLWSKPLARKELQSWKSIENSDELSVLLLCKPSHRNGQK